jgi:serine/threonine protein kinase
MLSQLKIDDYTCIETLLDNQYAGRTTYLAQDGEGQNVILKKFEFATPRSSWSAIKAIEKEMEVLRKLNHPQIPKYLNYLEIECGFILVIEYINASHLGCFKKRFTIEEVKAIARDILNILVYLQEQIPPVVHRDIKPENILWDGKKAYLIDFGIATAATQTMTLTSTVGGTIGFTAPEILRGRKATLNSDLYSLGVTLFCLLQNISSREIYNYTSFDGTLDWGKVTSIITDGAYRWLQELSHPNSAIRFQTPSSALKQIDLLKPRLEEKVAIETKKTLVEKLEKKENYQKTFHSPSKELAKRTTKNLNLYQKAFNFFDIGNSVVTLIMSFLTIIPPMAPPTFLALNVLSGKENLYFVYWIIIGVYWSSNVFFICTEGLDKRLNLRLISFFLNLTLRITEAVCLYAIYVHPDYYY